MLFCGWKICCDYFNRSVELRVQFGNDKIGKVFLISKHSDSQHKLQKELDNDSSKNEKTDTLTKHKSIIINDLLFKFT